MTYAREDHDGQRGCRAGHWDRMPLDWGAHWVSSFCSFTSSTVWHFGSWAWRSCSSSGRATTVAERRALLWLSGFGISHGTHEWFEAYLRVTAPAGIALPGSLDALRVVLLALSFACLLGYALGALQQVSPPYRRAAHKLGIGAGAILTAAVSFGIFHASQTSSWAALFAATSRYVLAVPAALMASMGMWAVGKIEVCSRALKHCGRLAPGRPRLRPVRSHSACCSAAFMVPGERPERGDLRTLRGHPDPGAARASCGRDRHWSDARHASCRAGSAATVRQRKPGTFGRPRPAGCPPQGSAAARGALPGGRAAAHLSRAARSDCPTLDRIFA